MARPAAISRVLPVPPDLQVELDEHPRAFYAGCAAARDLEGEDSNPYVEPRHRRAWAAGWLAVREGWIESLNHG